MIRTLHLIVLFSLFSFNANAQLGFCNGSKGLPIFFEDFGTGVNFGPQLPPTYTTYNFVSGIPDDGSYTIARPTNLNNSWHNTSDHTPNDENGKALIVNASFTAGEFYKRTVNGLCANTTFEFSAWVMNLYNSSAGACSGTGIPIDIKFEIWDSTQSTLLKEGSTGEIQGTSNPVWTQFGLTFTTLHDQTSVVLIMKNNGVGGCGNDLAIDDIMFRSCGDFTSITTSSNENSKIYCSNSLPSDITLKVITQGNSNYVYQWQESDDNENWNDIFGSTSNILNSVIHQTKYFRTKVAEDIANINNPYCHTVSEVFMVTVEQFPNSPVSNGNVAICADEIFPALSVQVDSANIKVNWYDAPVGGNLLQENSLSFTPDQPGTYYAEAYVEAENCNNTNRTPIKFEVFEVPFTFDSERSYCESQFIDLDANAVNVDYLWNTGETTRWIRVDSPGVYSVTLTNAAGCSSIRNINVIENPIPVISQISTNERTVTIITSNEGDFEYKLDGLDYQSSNIFYNVKGGLRKAYVRERNGCGVRTVSFELFIVPKYFSPNNDGFNDVFKIEGIGLETKVNIAIFDKNGKLITYLTDTNPSWDGTLNGTLLPATDYWYRAVFDSGEVQMGHFSLIR